MNRKNIWVHIVLAVVLVGLAAVAGQINKWLRHAPKEEKAVIRVTPKPVAVSRAATEREPEVFVRFKANVSPAEIRKIAASIMIGWKTTSKRSAVYWRSMILTMQIRKKLPNNTGG